MTKNCHLTLVRQKPYPSLAEAKPSVRRGNLNVRAHKRSLEALFLCPSFGGLYGAPSGGRSRTGISTSVQPATHCVETIGSGSQILYEDSIMQNHTQNSPIHWDYISAQDDLHRLITQSKALLFTITSNDNHNDLGPEALSDVLWLLTDRLRDVDAAYLHLITQSNLLVNQREVA